MRSLARFLAVVGVGAGTIVGMAVPVSAATTVDVVAGVESTISTGRAVPLRVTVKADRLIKGTVEVRARNQSGQLVKRIVQPIEVAGGATKDVVVVLPAEYLAEWQGNGGFSATVRVLDAKGEIASAPVAATPRSDVELVGVLPRLFERAKPPATATLTVPIGSARPVAFDPADLGVPGASDVFDMLAATPDDLRSITGPSLRELLGWVQRGGRLLVQANDAADVPGLPAEWQPGAASRSSAGRGEIARIAEGAWWDRLEPTPVWTMDNSRQFGGGEPFVNTLGRAAGFRATSVGWLAGFLAVYVLLVGPVLYLVLKRMKRPGLLWVAVPAMATLFTGGAAVIGGSQQDTNRQGYAAVIESSAAGSWTYAAVGGIAKGGALDTRLPAGWQAASTTTPFSWNGENSDAVATNGPKGTDLSINAGVGQFSALAGTGPIERATSFALSAAADGERVKGTVKNTSGTPLTAVAVFSGYGVQLVGDLAVGEERTFDVGGVHTRPNNNAGPFADPQGIVWGSPFDNRFGDGFMPPMEAMPVEATVVLANGVAGQIQPATTAMAVEVTTPDGAEAKPPPTPAVLEPVTIPAPITLPMQEQPVVVQPGPRVEAANLPLWDMYSQQFGGRPVRIGRVMAVGWTSAIPAPVDLGRRSSGTVALVSETSVRESARPGATEAAVAEVLRGFDPRNGGGGGGGAAVVGSWTLPSSAAAAGTRLQIRSTRSESIQLWDGQAWVLFNVSNAPLALPSTFVHAGRVYVSIASDLVAMGSSGPIIETVAA